MKESKMTFDKTKNEASNKLDYAEYYYFTNKIFRIIEDSVIYMCGAVKLGEPKSVSFGNMRMEYKAWFLGMSAKLYIDDKIVFKARKGGLAGTITYSTIDKEMITAPVLNNLFRIDDLIKTIRNRDLSDALRTKARREIGSLIRRD